MEADSRSENMNITKATLDPFARKGSVLGSKAAKGKMRQTTINESWEIEMFLSGYLSHALCCVTVFQPGEEPFLREYLGVAWKLW